MKENQNIRMKQQDESDKKEQKTFEKTRIEWSFEVIMM